MPQGHGRQRVADGLSNRTLADVVRGRSQAVAPTEALRALLMRGPTRSRLLTDVVRDTDRPSDVRAMCAVALGKRAAPSHVAALSEAVRDRDPAVVRRAAESLGRIGDAGALGVLEGVTLPRGQAKRSVDFARSLIAYRLGLDTHRLRRPPASSILRLEPRRAGSLEVKRANRPTVHRMLADAADELVGLELSDKGAVRFTCAEDYAVVLTTRIQQYPDAATLRRHSAVAGVVLQRSAATGRWFLDGYLLADPGPRATMRIFGTRPSGVITHVGELETRGGTFTVQAVDAPSTLPIEVGGSFDGAAGRLEFTSLRVQTQRGRSQRQPRQPRPLAEG